MDRIRAGSIIAVIAAAALCAGAQQGSGGMGDMPGMDMSGVDHSKAAASPAELGHTMQSMTMKHMDMGPHMKMTELRAPRAGDEERADKIAAELRSSIEKYKDVQVAEADGYKEFAPNSPSPMKHFTNWKYAMKAQFTFDPAKPTSLLYEKHGSEYKLIGAMYTAPKRYSEDDLDKRVPLSIAQWHEHVDLCMPPKDQRQEMYEKHPRFGLNGSITTRDECEAAGGRFYPVVFNWMVHVYPWEKTPQEMWSAERQHSGHAD